MEGFLQTLSLIVLLLEASVIKKVVAIVIILVIVHYICHIRDYASTMYLLETFKLSSALGYLTLHEPFFIRQHVMHGEHVIR